MVLFKLAIFITKLQKKRKNTKMWEKMRIGFGGFNLLEQLEIGV